MEDQTLNPATELSEEELERASGGIQAPPGNRRPARVTRCGTCGRQFNADLYSACPNCREGTRKKLQYW